MATLIYHFTALANLPSIARSGGLHSLNGMARDGIRHDSIAYESVQAKRAGTRVPCGPGGCLHDYVPFFFAPRSPMLYAIHKGRVPCPNGQDGLACIVSTAENIADEGIGFAFTDGHGIMALTNFYDDLRNLNRIDWKVMGGRYWQDTPAAPDRSRRRQAEFLVYNFVPWRCVLGIGVRRAATIDTVRASLGALGATTQVKVKSDYFFS
jgi:hypothetical protein